MENEDTSDAAIGILSVCYSFCVFVCLVSSFFSLTSLLLFSPIDHRPDLAETLAIRGRLLLSQDKPELALEHVQRAVTEYKKVSETMLLVVVLMYACLFVFVCLFFVVSSVG